MSSLYWFIAGFLSCLAFSLVGLALLVWFTPPAPKGSAAAEPRKEEQDDFIVTRLENFRRRRMGDRRP